MGRQREIDASLTEHPLDVLCEDLPRPHLQVGVLGRERIDQRRQRLIEGGERVREPQRSHLTSRRGPGLSPDAVGGVEGAPRFLDERLAGSGQLDAPVGPLEEPHPERLLDDLDLLRHRLLGDVQVERGAREAPLLATSTT